MYRRGFEIKENDKILVIEDVITTGGSVKEVIDEVTKLGGKISGVGVLVDRSNGQAKLHKNQFSIIELEAVSFEPDKVPDRLKDIPIQKPGSIRYNDKKEYYFTHYIFTIVVWEQKENKESIMDKEIAVISTKFGDIKLEFFDEIAPKSVESFKLHAKNGYYDGTIFHRVIPGFMIQVMTLIKIEDKSRHGTGGNAAKYFGIGDENSESTWDLPAEFSATPHERGCQWLGHKPDSGGSQFFICVLDARFLDNQHSFW